MARYHMKMIGKRLKQARQAAGLTQSALAEVANVDQSTLAHWERGKTKPDPEKVALMAPRLGVTEEWILYGRGKGVASPQSVTDTLTLAPVELPSPSSLVRDLPVRGVAAGSADGAFQLGAEPIDYVRRPPALARARDSYALYISGSSMEPEHPEGALRFVHPHKPIQIGDTVVVQVRGDSEENHMSYIKRLVRRNADHIILQQWNPDKQIKIPRALIVSIHKVLTLNELFEV